MADLEVYVLLGQGPWRIIHDVFEALQTLIELLLLLVDDAQPEVDFVGFFKVGRHAHDLRKGLFGVIQRSVTIVENPDSIPQPRLLYGESVHACKSWRVVPNTNLGVPEMVQGLLVGRIGFLKIVHHQMAVAFQVVSIGCNARIMETRQPTETAPSLSALGIQLQDVLEILDGLGKLLPGSEDLRDGGHARNGPLVVSEGLLIRGHCAIQVAHQLRQAAYTST